MKFIKDFFRFRGSLITEQERRTIRKTGYEERMGDEKFDIKARRRRSGKKLDYTNKYEDPLYSNHPWHGSGGIQGGKPGSKYATVWVPDVQNAFNDPTNRAKMVDYLKNYRGQDYNTVQRMIRQETARNGEENLWKSMLKHATDGKVGPYHRIVWNGMEEEDIINPKEPFLVTTQPNPTEGGTTTGDGTYFKDTVVTVTAKVNTDFTFINWTENGQEVSKDAEYKFTITANRDLVANFKGKDKDPDPDPDPDPVPIPPDEDKKSPKSETSDSATGNMGEKEKNETQYLAKGDTQSQKLLNFKYPLTGDQNSLGRYIVLDSSGSVTRDLEVGKKFTVKILSPPEKGLKSTNVERYVYFVSTHKGNAFPVEIYSFTMGKEETETEFTITPQEKMDLQMTMIISTVDLNPKTTNSKDQTGKYDIEGLTDGQCQDFKSELLKIMKPYEETAWRGPVFSAYTDKYVIQ